MIYLGLKFYLRTNLPKPTIGFIWTKEHNKKLFEYLQSNFSDDELLKSRNRLEIKQAFIDFFEPVGYILIRLKENQIGLKIFPYKIEAKDSKYLNTIVKLIDYNKNFIDFNFQDREDQVAIQGKLRRKIYALANAIEDEEINKRLLVKHAVKIALKLKDSDIIVNKKRKILIKIFTVAKRVVKKEELNTEANRFNGFSKEELDSLYEEYFDKDKINDFLHIVAKKLFQDFFIDKKTSNRKYEKTIYQCVQNIVAEELLEITNKNQEFRIGFSGFVFRVNFIKIFKLISEDILRLLSSKDSSMNDFLKFYSGDIFMEDGKRYQPPLLITNDGRRWNPTAIYSIVTTWFKINDHKNLLNKKFKDLEVNMRKLHIKDKTPEEHQASLLEQKHQFNVDIESKRLKVEDLINEKHLAKDDQSRSKINVMLENIKSEIETCKSSEEDIRNKIRNLNSLQAYKNLKDESLRALKEIKRYKKMINSSSEAYLSIEEALVRALTSKSKIID